MGSDMALHLDMLKKQFPEKFQPDDIIFSNINRGNSIFIGSSCGEPQQLVRSLVNYTEKGSGDIFGSEVIHIWTLGVAPYTEKQFEENFRHNSFFISND